MTILRRQIPWKGDQETFEHALELLAQRKKIHVTRSRDSILLTIQRRRAVFRSGAIWGYSQLWYPVDGRVHVNGRLGVASALSLLPAACYFVFSAWCGAYQGVVFSMGLASLQVLVAFLTQVRLTRIVVGTLFLAQQSRRTA